MNISGVIITYNEEDNLEDCLNSLKDVVDEVIVVDSFSTDRTKAIAESFGVRFFEHKFEGHIQQKNYAINLAENDWVLALDADERLSNELREGIKVIKSSEANAKVAAYQFNRLSNYCGKWIRHSGWYPDTKIRLWNRRLGKWGGVNPHDSVKLDVGVQVKKIKGDLEHYSFYTLEQHLSQINKFTTIAAQESYKRGKRVTFAVHVVLYPFWLFIKNFFLKLGFLDGYFGFIICINGAFYKYQKYIKLYLLERRKK
ncbi:MAG: glycosyltransferase family 2 protein [Bacteroidota bacterium]